jgi:hypothetical protein
MEYYTTHKRDYEESCQGKVDPRRRQGCGKGIGEESHTTCHGIAQLTIYLVALEVNYSNKNVFKLFFVVTPVSLHL